jgi:hypothetical protein
MACINISQVIEEGCQLNLPQIEVLAESMICFSWAD